MKQKNKSTVLNKLKGIETLQAAVVLPVFFVITSGMIALTWDQLTQTPVPDGSSMNLSGISEKEMGQLFADKSIICWKNNQGGSDWKTCFDSHFENDSWFGFNSTVLRNSFRSKLTKVIESNRNIQDLKPNEVGYEIKNLTGDTQAKEAEVKVSYTGDQKKKVKVIVLPRE